jgi:plastocyanin
MIFNLKSGGIISIYIFLCFFLNGCTTPEENAIKVPESDSVAIAPEKSGAKVDTVEIKDMKFQPAEITVKKGDTIVWINHDMVTH